MLHRRIFMHTRITLASTLLLVALATFAEEPRQYMARPLDGGVVYSQRARDAYAAGVWTLDEIAASEPSADKAIEIYRRAQAAFEEAVRAEPAMYEAHTYFGYIHRKLGRYKASLEAYRTALELKPDYVYAIEYQGEAYLGLGDFDRARFNYLRLYALDRELAKKLLDAMEEWTSSTSDEDATKIAGARAWIAEQRQRNRSNGTASAK
jgi:tetratricopeptide (TPR) repeat protein